MKFIDCSVAVLHNVSSFSVRLAVKVRAGKEGGKYSRASCYSGAIPEVTANGASFPGKRSFTLLSLGMSSELSD